MTERELWVALKKMLDEYRAKPQQHLSGRVVVVLKRKGRPPGGERVRIYPGLTGRLLCVNSDGGIVLDVEVGAIERFLENHRGWAS